MNVASDSSHIRDHYSELVQLQRRYSEKFVVLGFACNQFGELDPGDEKKKFDFVNKEYRVNFQMFMWINAIGKHQNNLYKWLDETTGKQPTWNFCKYLLNENGNVVRFAKPTFSPLFMKSDIKNLLAGEKVNRSIFAYEENLCHKSSSV